MWTLGQSFSVLREQYLYQGYTDWIRKTGKISGQKLVVRESLACIVNASEDSFQ